MTSTGIDLLDKYASLATHRLGKFGLDVERGEIESELWLVYDKCRRRYNPENETGATFETYLKRALEYKVARIARERLLERQNIPYEVVEDVIADGNMVEKDPLSNLIAKEQIRAMFKEITDGRRLIVLNEMLNPSLKVRNAMAAITNHLGATKGGGAFITAMSLVYGFSKQNVRHHVYGIRIIAKKVLTV